MKGKRPDYVPLPAWKAANELINGWGECKESQNIRLLLDEPNLGNTWKRFEKMLAEDPTGIRWRKVFDLLATLPMSINKGFRSAVKDADKLIEEIAHNSKSLADKIAKYIHICERNYIEYPDELSTIQALITTTEQHREAHANETCWQWYSNRLRRDDSSGDAWDARSSYFFDLGLAGSEVSRALTTMSDIANNHENRILDDLDLVTISGNVSIVSDYVRHFDYRLDNDYKLPSDLSTDSLDAQIKYSHLPSNFTVGNADLARILSTLLKIDAQSDSVRKARQRKKRTL